MGRIVNASGPDSRPMFVQGNPVPYTPASLDTANATLTTHASESIEGAIGDPKMVPGTDWAWAKCSAANPFPGTPDPSEICLKSGFDPRLLYQVVFTARDPYVLGVGFAAFRDVAVFFRNATRDAEGTPNPVAGNVSWVISRGRSQSGNFLRAFIQLGFTQSEDNRRVYDGAWPIIAGRRVTLNARFAEPDGALMMYQAGSEGPLWWANWPDPVRGLPAAGILDRCAATKTCPKIIEHFGSAEVWGLQLSPNFVGTSADKDIPLPANVRRYYIPATPHGGGAGGFSVVPAAAPACPGTNFGRGIFAANPVPHTETFNALRVHFRNWVMKETPPPASVWPTLAGGYLVEPTKEALGFPTIPGVPVTAPTGLINPVRDYDLGPGFNYVDGSGVPSRDAARRKASHQDESRSSRQRRQRARRRAGGVARRAARHVPRMEHRRGRFLQRADLQLRRWHDPVCDDQSRACGRRRPAPVAGGALHESRRLRRGGEASRRKSGKPGFPAAA